jgi:hypothetical protein
MATKNFTDLIEAYRQVAIEARELLLNAEYADGYGTVLTQDCEALEQALAAVEDGTLDKWQLLTASRKEVADRLGRGREQILADEHYIEKFERWLRDQPDTRRFESLEDAWVKV